MIHENRYAEFRIHRSHLEAVPELWPRLVIVRAELNFFDDCVHYHAYSPDFAIVSECEMPPAVRVYRDASGQIRFAKPDADLEIEGFVQLDRRA